MANLRLQVGNGRVETYQIRRASAGSRGGERGGGATVEALRGDLPAFVRAADSSNPTSSLDHPVVERLGKSDLVEDDAIDADDDLGDAMPGGGHAMPLLRARFS